jgi:uncharacterized protein DUF4339
MLYYYLDGLDKKGPYTGDELKSRNLNEETMVFSDGMSNWTAIKNLPELHKILFATLIIAQETISPDLKQKNEIIAENKDDTTKSANTSKQKKIRIPAIIFLIIGITATVGASYLVVKKQRATDLELMNKKISEVLQGKDEVCDHKKTGVTGELKDADLLTSTDNDGKKLVEYYECKSGGFTVLTLTKKPNGYDIIETYSKDMGYKIPASKWTPSKDYGYGIYTSGYSTSTYRQSIQTAYDEAMNFLSTEKENKSFVAGFYERIKTFNELQTDFFYIDNVEPTTYSSVSNFYKSWKNSGWVYNSDWIVWYENDGKHYEIEEKKKVFTKQLIIFSSIGSIITIMIYLFIRYRRKIGLQVT